MHVLGSQVIMSYLRCRIPIIFSDFSSASSSSNPDNSSQNAPHHVSFQSITISFPHKSTIMQFLHHLISPNSSDHLRFNTSLRFSDLTTIIYSKDQEFHYFCWKTNRLDV